MPAGPDSSVSKWTVLWEEVTHGHNNLGVMYDKGMGIPQDNRKALPWYQLAAERGVGEAQFNLATGYSKGEGVLEDYVKAYAWLSLAVAKGNERATRVKRQLRPRMTVEQVAEVQRLSREIYNRIEASKTASRRERGRGHNPVR